MSGIFGIFSRDGRPVGRDELFRMSDAMSHRGPDGHSVRADGPIGLGHRLLRTTPGPQGGRFPSVGNGRGLAITADARIDNRDELLSLLAIDRLDEKFIPDSYLILAAYRKWGRGCVDHLIGDFSFAIWDADQRKLFCVRDHMGIRPLIYYLSKRLFVFASEVGSIRVVNGVNTWINEGRIADFLVTQLEGIDKTSTFYDKIFRLPPAHFLEVSRDRVLIQCYWQPDQASQIIYNSDAEYQAAFQEIYTDAVRKRMRGTKVASMLSGGIDSSSIASIAGKLQHSLTGEPFPVFSAVSVHDTDCKETSCIEAVLRQGTLLSHTVTTSDVAVLREEMNRVIDSLQEPYDPMLMIIVLYLKAVKSGFRVMLDGVDGDFVTSLFPLYPACLLREGRYISAFNEMQAQRVHYYGKRLSLPAIMKKNLLAAFIPQALKTVKRRWSRKASMADVMKKSVINRDFAARINLEERLERLRAHGGLALDSSLAEQHRNTILHPYLTVGVERYGRVAAGCGIEDRHPLLDKRVVEFMVGVPWDQKVRLGWSKFMLRRISEKILPPEVCWRQGREHIGWTYHQKWLEENFNRIIATVRNGLLVRKKYLDNEALLNILSKSGVNELIEADVHDVGNFLKAFHLINWFTRQK